jgi:heme-degrading monooxygenase HmoA
VTAGYAYIWEYIVSPDRLADFQKAYGPAGEWVQLFRKAPGYRRTELHRDQTNAQRFVTIDYWESAAAWQAFRSHFAAEFEALDARCETLTLHERELGRFDPIV